MTKFWLVPGIVNIGFLKMYKNVVYSSLCFMYISNIYTYLKHKLNTYKYRNVYINPLGGLCILQYLLLTVYSFMNLCLLNHKLHKLTHLTTYNSL